MPKLPARHAACITKAVADSNGALKKSEARRLVEEMLADAKNKDGVIDDSIKKAGLRKRIEEADRVWATEKANRRRNALLTLAAPMTAQWRRRSREATLKPLWRGRP